MKRLAPLGYKTQAQYDRILTRAYGSPENFRLQPHGEVFQWPDSGVKLLRAAVKRKAEENDLDPGPLLAQLPEPTPGRKKRLPHIPAEEELLAYEKAAKDLPIGKHALAMIPMVVGMRADELLNLPREDVRRAVKTGEIRFIRKGDKEHVLPVEHAKALFEELLEVRIPGKWSKQWEVVGEILSRGHPHTRYQLLHRLVKKTGEAAGIPDLRPHLLRHGFATRMHRDGAPVAAIQYALGHANVQTTMIYVHPNAEDVKRFVRKPQG